MPIGWIIVDGYNSIHKENELVSLLERDVFLARRSLVRMLEDAIPQLTERVTVVFDGRGETVERDAQENSPVEVVFSPANCSADTLIERMVSEAAAPHRILVVTSDNLEANAVSASGAAAQSCESFFSTLRQASKSNRTRNLTNPHPSKFGRIGDMFPD